MILTIKKKVDSNGKFYLPRELQKAGFTGELILQPGRHAALIYPADAGLDEVIASAKVLLEEATKLMDEEH